MTRELSEQEISQAWFEGDVHTLRTEIERLRAWAKEEQRGRHQAEEDRMHARSEVERLKAQMQKGIEQLKIENNDRVTRLLAQIVAMRFKIERLTAGLQMLAKQEYDRGYTPEGFAEAILSGEEP